MLNVKLVFLCEHKTQVDNLPGCNVSRFGTVRILSE